MEVMRIDEHSLDGRAGSTADDVNVKWESRVEDSAIPAHLNCDR